MKENYSWQVHMARIYLKEARVTKFRGWKLTLLGFAAARRKKAIGFIERFPVAEQIKTGQLDLFGGLQ